VPTPRRVLNAFTAKSVHKITGISVHMLNYLCRHGYLKPAYVPRKNERGKVRYFSYRDLVIASVVQRLRRTGVKLRKLKEAVSFLHDDAAWFVGSGRRSQPVQWLVSDGGKVLVEAEDGFMDELRPGGQRAFAFIVHLEAVQTEVKKRVERVEPEKVSYFAIENKPLMFKERSQRRAAE
jgi:DNA-binding transcriptional MerR regulator